MHSRMRSALPLCLALFAAPVVAQIGLRDALPDNTIIYVGAPDLDTSLAEMENMPLMRMWNEAEVQDFLADAMQMAEEKWEEALAEARQAHEAGELPFDPDELMQLRVHGMALALTSLDLRTTDNDAYPHVGFVAQLDFGNSAAAWKNVIEFALKMLEEEAGGELTRDDTTIGDQQLITLVPPETEMSLNISFVGTGMVFGTDRGEVTKVIENLVSGAKELSASASFKSTFEQLDGHGAELECFVQPGPALDFLFNALDTVKAMEPDFPEQVDVDGIRRAFDALGVNSLKTIGSTSSYKNRGDDKSSMAVSKTFCWAPAADRKGMFAASDTQLDMGFLRWVPKDVATFTALSFDLNAAWEGLVGAVQAYDEEQSKQWLGMLSAYEEQFGVSVQEDLVGSIGNELIWWTMPGGMMMTAPEVGILLEVKDPERLVTTLETLFQLSNGMFELDQSKRRGLDLYSIQINYDPTGGGMGMNPFDMFAPRFSFKDGYLVAAFSTGDVKRAFKRMDREDDPSGDIRSSTEFVGYLDQLPKSGVAALSFQDWKTGFESMYQVVTSMTAFIPMNDDIPVDLSLLPDVSTLTQHLFGSVSWTTIDGNGFHGYSQSPWGPEAMALVAGAAGLGTAVLAGTKMGGW